MQAYFLVFLGGGLGSMSRFGIARLLHTYDLDFPLATLIANALSCIVLGFMVGMSLKGKGNFNYQFLIITGFCGGFSTFSTFSNETFQLLTNGELFFALVNIFGSLLLCLFCIYLGMKMA